MKIAKNVPLRAGTFRPGVSGNPGGRPKGVLTRDALNIAIVNAIMKAEGTKDASEAISRLVARYLRANKIKLSDVLSVLERTQPKSVELSGDLTVHSVSELVARAKKELDGRPGGPKASKE